jgi:type IV pilus assembly protein PilY1
MLSGAAASAATDNACWNRDIERLDYYLNPPEKGDNGFFTGATSNTGNTNVTMVYPDKVTMRDFTQRLYRIRVDLGGTGCSNAYLNGLTYFMSDQAPAPAGSAANQGVYSSAKTYPDPGNYVEGTAAANSGYDFTDGLTSGRYYRYRNWGANGSGVVTDATWNGSCDLATAVAADRAACYACSASGYWLNPTPPAGDKDVSASAGVFSTNWLRFNPPKWVLLHLAYKRMMAGPLLAILREAALAPNGTVGAQLIQKMLPQSCNGNGRPMNQKMGAIDGLTYSSAANPLAEMLFNTGWYMGGQEDPWIFGSAGATGTYPTTFPNTKSEPCSNCTGDFAVLFSDGRGDSANPSCDSASPAPWCLATSNCSATGVLGMGAEDDGDDFLNPAGVTGATITGAAVRATPSGTCNFDFADDVAGFIANNAVSASTPTKIRTYVVGIGDKNNTYGEMSILEQIALAGGTTYRPAGDFAELEAIIEDVLLSIINRSTSFSAAAITSVQTRGSTSAFIPRFQPAPGSKWAGALSRYDLYNEFAAGCTEADYGTVSAVNPNGNDSCTDFYLRAADGGFVAENSNGEFSMLDHGATWDAGWPFRTQADGGSVPAGPIWEASLALTSRVQAVIGGDTSQARKIYTAQPNGSGGYLSTAVPFTTANVATITPLLKLGGVSGEICLALSTRTRNTYSTEEDCARDIIRFVHGEDVLMENPLNRLTPVPSPLAPRPKILGDIFHSTPVLVTPPAPTFLCDLGVVSQCVASLFSPTLTPGGTAAYDAYARTSLIFDRKQFVLVGSNDGMLHAFLSGSWVSGPAFSAEYDFGTGEELWAFIPPDLLPKLTNYMLDTRHELYVDGTPMVRDVWVDGSGASATVDHIKDSDEYHTVAVTGEREGGRYFFALDVTRPDLAPTFLWSFPHPGTTEALAMGESWNDLGPNSPPIGPIAEEDAAGPLTVGGLKAKERYVVAFGGGFDPAYLRGRSIHVVDVWTGTQLYKLDRTFAPSLFPVAAPVSMLDTDSDGLFDSAVVGDTGGQVWTLSLMNPGVDTTSDGLFDNWFGARAFVQFKGDQIAKRAPFFQRAVAAKLDTGEFRVFLGSGDRSQIKDSNGGACGLANISACVRKSCDVDIESSTYEIDGHYVQDNLTIVGGATTVATNTTSVDALGQSLSCSAPIEGEIEFSFSCPQSSGPDWSATWTSEVYCDWSSDAGVECPVDTGRPMNTAVCLPNGASCLADDDCCSESCAGNVCASLSYKASSLQNTRFYSIKLFDTGNRALFLDGGVAGTYDSAALTDTGLVDMTLNPALAASASGDGWFVTQTNANPGTGLASDERTANSGLLLGGCVMWGTLRPNPVQTLTCGGSLPLDNAYAYQADAITGSIQCGQAGSAAYAATTRSVVRTTYAAPQQPAPVISVNKLTGEVMYGSVSIDPGSAPSSTSIGGSEIFGVVHWLEVPRTVHECRHNGTCN